MVARWRQARRRRRAECPECGAPRVLTGRLDKYRVEHEALWAAVEALTAERDHLIRRLSGVAEHDPDIPPPPGARELGGARVNSPGRLGFPSRTS